MKCPCCHTNLPDFRPFEKKLCPNCAAAVVPQQKQSSRGNSYIYLFAFGFATLMTLLLLATSISEAIYYRANRHTFVETEAVICNIVEQVDSDDDVDHDVYISFTFNGVRYEDVSYSYYHSGMQVGDQLSVEVDPADPYDLPEMPTVPLIISAVMLAVMGSLFWFLGLKPLLGNRNFPSMCL